jgi:hypothetical protein
MYGGPGYLVDANGVPFVPQMQMYPGVYPSGSVYADSATGLQAHYTSGPHSPGGGYGAGDSAHSAGYAQQTHMHSAAARYMPNGMYSAFHYAQGGAIPGGAVASPPGAALPPAAAPQKAAALQKAAVADAPIDK